MRGKRAEEREIKPDPKYNSVKLAKFINHVMRKGKKSKAQKIVYSALDIVAQKTKRDPLVVFEEALENVGPVLEVKPRRIGGATYQIPVEVRPKRRLSLAMRWIINAAREKKGRPMFQKLADEIIQASKGEGAAIKKKQDIHKMAEANRAFAHFAW